MVMLRAKLGAAAGAVKNFFTGGKAEQDPAVKAMEALRVRGVWVQHKSLCYLCCC
jgi:hypothetical protein